MGIKLYILNSSRAERDLHKIRTPITDCMEEENKGAVTVEGDGAGCSEERSDEVHGSRQGVRQGQNKANELREGEPWLLLAMFV